MLKKLTQGLYEKALEDLDAVDIKAESFNLCTCRYTELDHAPKNMFCLWGKGQCI